jgi:flavin reductase (DIM6/NTAB) family NADH-FMN oxidoreductase RutF
MCKESEKMISFRESMSCVANTVSVIALSNELSKGGLIAVTISSLVSTSVEENQEEVMFTLKTDSHAAKYLDIGTQFSINVLSDSQKSIADFYGKSLGDSQNPALEKSVLWVENSAAPRLKNALIVMGCSITDRVTRRNSSIFFARVVEFSHTSDLRPLLHFKRSYFKIGLED